MAWRIEWTPAAAVEAEAEAAKYALKREGLGDRFPLESLGLVATCNPQGAGKWSAVTDCARTALRGRRVTIIADKDDAGRKHAADVAAWLADVAAEVRSIESPVGKDAAAWVAAGATDRDIESTAAIAAAWGTSDAQGETAVDSDPFEAEVARARWSRRITASRATWFRSAARP